MFSSVSEDTERALLVAWTHPFFTKPTNPEPSPACRAVQSEALPSEGSPPQLDVEQVKVEVVVTTEEEEAVVGLTEKEASNQSSDTPEALDR